MSTLLLLLPRLALRFLRAVLLNFSAALAHLVPILACPVNSTRKQVKFECSASHKQQKYTVKLWVTQWLI